MEKVPDQVTLPLDMCVGTPAVPVVSIGDIVKVGQMIAKPTHEDGVPIHASISGHIQSLTPDIVIKSDGRKKAVSGVAVQTDELSQEELIHTIREFGITEMSGEPIAAHCKIIEARGRVDTLIINGTESEPYLTSTHRQLMEQGADFLAGAKILSRVLGVNRTVLAITGDKLNAVERIERMIGKDALASVLRKNIVLRTLPNRYPLWDEKQIINVVTGREIPANETAVAVHCSVFSVATVCAIGHSMTTGRAITSRAITVGGWGIKRPRNLLVPFGTSIACLIENCAGTKDDSCTILVGGWLMGVPMKDVTQPIVRNTEGILVLSDAELPREYKQEACLQCGFCIEACPMYLTPIFVHRALAIGDKPRLISLHPQDCIGCSACSAICPSHIPLVQIMEQGGQIVKTEGSEQ